MIYNNMTVIIYKTATRDSLLMMFKFYVHFKF